MSKQKKDRSDWDLTEDADQDRIGDDVINQGHIDEDRAALFPDQDKTDPNPDDDPPPNE